MQVAVIIPVYQQPKHLAAMLACLLADPYPHKQIIVAVDGPLNQEILAALEPYQGRVRVDSDGEYRGKAQTLNRVVPSIAAETLVFLDNDLKLCRRPDLLERLAFGMETCDLLELPKQAEASNWLSHLIAFEFLDNAITAWLFMRLVGHCPGMNGSAFAVRKNWFLRLEGFRRVIDEDSDFAARAFSEWARFGFDPKLQVQTEVPLTLHDWFHQRRRWALNNLFWLKDNLTNVVLHALRSPRLFFSFLVFILPFVLIPLCFLILRANHISILLPSLFMLVQHEHGLAAIFLGITHFHLFTQGGLLSVALAFAFSLGLHYGFARFLHFHFKFWPFVIYYFVYSPIWILISLVFWLRLAIRGHLDVDWKI